MSREFNVAVLGATGAVGETMLRILAERDFPAGEVHALASRRSAGKSLPYKDGHLTIEDAETFDFSKADIGLFSAGGSVSAEYAPKAVEAGCVVVDNTSQYRREPDVPLVVPEVNAHAIAGYRKRGIVANPNCSTIQMVVALKPLHDEAGIVRLNVATYQAVSGSGKSAIEELRSQSKRLMNGGEIETPTAYPKQIAFNALPHIDVFMDNGYTKEEMKMVWETHKILENESIQVNPTAVRVPVFYGHSEAIHVETREKLSAERTRELLAQAPGIELLDKPESESYPTAVTEGAGHDGVYVGRIREDLSYANGLNLWVVSDNLRKGAALNSVQIAEHLVWEYIK